MSYNLDAVLEAIGITPEDTHPQSRRFYDLVIEGMLLHHQKQQDYGNPVDPFANLTASEEFGVPAWRTALIRLNEKVTRLKSFCRNGSLANEGVEDSLKDIGVYAFITLVLREREGA